MIETQEDENSLLEYFIVGAVILFFGGLYYFINHFGDSSEQQPAYAAYVETPSAADTTEALRKAGIVIPDSEASADAKQASATKAKTADTSTDDSDSDDKAAELAVRDAELKKADEENQQAIAALAEEKSKLQGEVATLRSNRDKLLATNSELIEQAEAVIRQTSAAKQAAAQTAQPQPQALAQSKAQPKAQTRATDTGDAWVVSYQLPDGTVVDIADQGFEGLLKQALEVKTLNKPIIFDSIYFESGAAEPTNDSQQQIIATAALLNAHQDAQVLIKGHTDNSGNARNNTLLSLSRSGFMKNALVKLGIDMRRINVEGVGSLEPIASNTTVDGRNTNRRIELILIK